LPWAEDALEPAISARTIALHYGKHHRSYVEKANKLIAGTRYAEMDEEDIIRESARDPDAKNIFNNVAQAYNHARYWESLSPEGGAPAGDLAKQIKKDFGDLAGLKKALLDAGEKHFASGWAHLAWTGDKLVVVDTHDADTPVRNGHAPLLTIDVWEHAYYLDVQNERPKYLKQVIDTLLDWKRAARKLAALT
jgi:Fe-Mn family superoxide dismutase